MLGEAVLGYAVLSEEYPLIREEQDSQESSGLALFQRYF